MSAGKITLDYFNQNYIYTSDGTLDSWNVGTPDEDGLYRMDCEDYCLTPQAKVDGFKNLELYYCKCNGQGHCIGKLDGQWIDCGLQQLVDTLPPFYTDIRKYWLVEIWSKKLCGKVFRWLNKYLKK